MPVAEALARVLAGTEPPPAQAMPLADAHGHVLAEDLAALRTQPPADVSAMDGYAVRATDVAKVPVRLKIIGEVAAGHPFEGKVGAGEAARIFTGGVLPSGTDTIVIQEHTTREGDAVIVTTAAGKGKHVRVAGLDFARGALLLEKGRRLRGSRRSTPPSAPWTCSACRAIPTPPRSGGSSSWCRRFDRRRGGATSNLRSSPPSWAAVFLRMTNVPTTRAGRRRPAPPA